LKKDIICKTFLTNKNLMEGKMAEVIKDELLGEIECVDGFETEVNWVNNKKIDVYFDISDYQLLNEKDEEKTDKEKMEDRIKTLKEILSDVNGWNEKIIKNSAEVMLELANDWFDVEDYYEDDEIDEFVEDMKQVLSEESAEKLRDSEITQETMEKIMSVERLTIYGDGNFSIYLSDNDMIFSGHIINVLANINGEFSEGDIMGMVLLYFNIHIKKRKWRKLWKY